jgi:hypothetical protein
VFSLLKIFEKNVHFSIKTTFFTKIVKVFYVFQALSASFPKFIITKFLGCWCSTCVTVLLLAFNRLLDLSLPHLSDSLFHGKRVFAWLAIPICYGLYYWWFSCPCLYNSNFYACFLDPYFGLSIDHTTDVVYANFLFSINNIAIIVALGTVYIGIIFALIAKTRFANSKSVSAIQRQVRKID